MRLGYNTNGLAHHRLVDAIDLLADEGYQSIAITLDAGEVPADAVRAHLGHAVEASQTGTPTPAVAASVANSS